MFHLDGKVAMITGAAQGQGAAEARLFAELGARVVVADILDDKGRTVAADIGGTALYVHLDVSDEEDWAGAVRTAEATFGPVNILVNNAGTISGGRLEDTRLDDCK